MKPSIIRLRALEKQLYAYLYAMTVIDFDAETVAPEGSADGRAEATEVLSRASFDLLVNDGTAALLKEAAADAETEQERAEVRNLQRQYDEIARIPADEYAAFTKLCSQSVPAWTKAKRTNDFSLFAPYLEKLIAASYRLLGLISYLTAGEKETRAWTIKVGTKAPQAAGKIHSDFERGFIRAEVVSYDDLIACGSHTAAKEKGLIRLEGKDYVVKDGDIMLFRFNV